MNVIDALNIFYREDVISDFLKSCFEDSTVFLHQFLTCANIKLPEESQFTIINRLGLGKNIGTPDMVIVAQTPRENHVIIIENKLGAAEGIAQTPRYASSKAKEMLQSKLQLNHAELHFHFVYLTLDTTVAPSNTNFTHVYYDAFLKHEWLLNDATLTMFFSDFQEKLHQFYEPLKQPFGTLSSNLQQLDRTQKKICWQSILLETFQNAIQFELDWGELGRMGRNNFLFLLTKSNWKSEKSFEEVGLANTYNIHIDTYINLLHHKNNFIHEIGVRFETYPYVPHNNIKFSDGYEHFIRNKSIFAERLFQHISPYIEGVKKRNSKLLLITIPVHNSDLTTSIEDYKNKVILVERAIDATLKDLQEEHIL